MSIHILKWAAILSACLGVLTGWADAEEQPILKSDLDKQWQHFADEYCIKCHGPAKQKGKLRLDAIVPSGIDDETHAIWKRVIAQLEKGEMPPEESDHQPNKADASAIGGLLARAVISAERSGRLKGDEVLLKRLNRTQYRNTLGDLMKIDTHLNDPTLGFPDDSKSGSFDTVYDDLKMSDALMEIYLRAASQVIDLVTCDGTQPKRIYRQYIDKTDQYRLEGGVNGDTIGHEIYNHYDLDRGYWFTPQENGHARTIGTPFTSQGVYKLSFEVKSLWRDRADMTAKLKEYSPKLPHQFAIRLLSPEGIFPEVEYTVAIHDLPDNKRVNIEHEIWVPKNWRIQLCFDNGPACPMWVLYQELLGWHEIPTPPNATPTEKEEIKKKNKAAPGGTYTTPEIKEYMRTAISPRIRIYKMAIDGPIFSTWPPEYHSALYSSSDDKAAIRNFSRRAFRRTVPESELVPFYKVAAKDGYKMAIKAMLCSPNFIYIYENEGKLDNDALANRLSYALTDSMPDDTLFKLADEKKLTDLKVFNEQIERLLDSPRLDNFIDSFVSQWLRLHNVEKMPPDEKKYPSFYKISHGYTGTKDAILKEPLFYFKHLIANNLPVSLLIDSDFAFMNDSLAEFYGVNSVDGSGFRKVNLEPGLKRGGLLGMAAVLAASANGVDTSPVVRGIYVLDNLLGMPPAPPPPGIKLPQPDIRGATTIRGLLEKHSIDKSCNTCHKSIDPIGFSMENFDAVGHWRTRYQNGPVDSSGKLPNGRVFSDIVGFKIELVNETAAISENLIRKLLTYFTGRKMGPMDEAEISRINQQLQAKGYRMRDTIKAILNSEIFLNK